MQITEDCDLFYGASWVFLIYFFINKVSFQ